jgi:UDP-N-acetylmuramoylalanine--D-glutamate ligase
MWLSYGDTIDIVSKEVDRFKSPITYRPVYENDSWRVYLYLDQGAIDSIKSRSFEIHNSRNREIENMRIYEEFSLEAGDHAVYERDGEVFLWDGACERTVIGVADIILPGRHNVENYMTAIALTEEYASAEDVLRVATTFEGVAHRLERVRVHEGVTYYNSSIDSTPTRTAAALSALTERPIVICGGYDKNVPFEPLADALCARAKAVVLTGATAEKIRSALEQTREVQNGTLPVYENSNFVEAVLLAKSIAQKGDTVLLSPACASFDAFKNFEDRGNTFRRIVEHF